MIRIYKTKIINQKRKITLTLKNAVIPLNGRQKVLNACASGIFPKRKQREELTSISDHVAPVAPIVRVAKVSDHKVFDHKQRKILTPKQILQRLPIALSQVGNTSENLLSEIRQIIYYLYRSKEITKKIYNNIMNSIKLWNRMNTIFTNSGNSKTSDTQRLSSNALHKINLKKSDKYIALSNIRIYYTWKSIEKSYKNNKFKISAPI